MSLTMPVIETHKEFKTDESNSNGNECWGCGHWLIGGGCWKYGDMGAEHWRSTSPSDSCEEWVEEDTPGTITGEIRQHIRDGEQP